MLYLLAETRVKTCLGIEEVQLLDYDAIRTLVAFAWVAAGFLLHLGVTLEQAEVRLLAYLGGWEERANRPPGKLILTRGLRRLLICSSPRRSCKTIGVSTVTCRPLSSGSRPPCARPPSAVSYVRFSDVCVLTRY